LISGGGKLRFVVEDEEEEGGGGDQVSGFEEEALVVGVDVWVKAGAVRGWSTLWAHSR